MAYKTCPDCGSRMFEHGCVNCNESDYISMQGAYDEKKVDIWECFNAFKENGKMYRYGDRITDAEYQNISERNKKWFFKVS